jgi:hypothetical protein
VKAKKIKSWVGLIANAGVVSGLVFLGYEVQQNTTQMRAEAAYSINEALSIHNSAIYNDAVFADIAVRGDKGLSSLNPVEQSQYFAYQYDRINLAIYVLDLEYDGISGIHFPYVDRLVQDFHRRPGLQEFLILVEDEWVGHPELYEKLRLRNE